MCFCFYVFVRVCACLCVCVCLCSCVFVFLGRFSNHFYQVSGPFWKLFGGFLEVAASRQPWPLPSRVEFHFEPFPCTFLHASWSPSWRQDRPSWSQDGAKLPNLALSYSTWHLARLCVSFYSLLLYFVLCLLCVFIRVCPYVCECGCLCVCVRVCVYVCMSVYMVILSGICFKRVLG